MAIYAEKSVPMEIDLNGVRYVSVEEVSRLIKKEFETHIEHLLSQVSDSVAARLEGSARKEKSTTKRLETTTDGSALYEFRYSGRGKKPKHPKETVEGRKARDFLRNEALTASKVTGMHIADVYKTLYTRLSYEHGWKYEEMSAALLGPNGKYTNSIASSWTISVLRQGYLEKAVEELRKLGK